jgi:murein DD-endopeptidase MepM/ murein hydrolase activator NlpD
MRALPWVLGGGVAALAAYYWTRRDVTRASDKSPASSAPPPAPSTRPPPPSTTPRARIDPLPGRWVWPVGVWNGRKPEVSDGMTGTRHSPSGQVILHGGVDLMYRRRPGDTWRANTPHASPGWVMPDDRAALAASDGLVVFAANTPRGWSVRIDHAPRKLTTYYTHLSSLLASKGKYLTAGTPIGIIGGDPLDAAHLMHLHFELWRGGSSDRVDPEPLMTSWEYLRDPAESTAPLVARNGGHRMADGNSYSVPVESHTRRPPRR